MIARIAFLVVLSVVNPIFAQTADSTVDSSQNAIIKEALPERTPLITRDPDSTAVPLQTVIKKEDIPKAPPPQVEAKVFIPEVASQKEAKKEIVFPQDPRLSSFLSVTFPGLGQLYQGNYLKALFFTGTFVISSAVIFYYNTENKERNAEQIEFYDKDNNLRKLSIRNEDFGSTKLTTSEKTINVAAFAFVGISYIWSVIDAYHSAKSYNKKHFFSGQAYSSGKVGLKPYYTEKEYGAELVYQF